MLALECHNPGAQPAIITEGRVSNLQLGDGTGSPGQELLMGSGSREQTDEIGSPASSKLPNTETTSPRLWLENGEGQGANCFKVHVADLCFCFSHWISSSSARPPLISVSASKERRGGTWLSGQNENTDSSLTCCPFRKSPRAHGGSSAQLSI